MISSQNNLLSSRYPGLKPFTEIEQSLFFGREKDLEALNSLIYIKQAVILYGKSGYGKSSLINAGIIPRLKKHESWEYYSIRFNNFSDKEIAQNLSPSVTVKQRFSEKASADKGAWFSRLFTADDSFWYWIKLNQLVTKCTKFIIFFDQFEELFTYPKEQIIDFSEQLSQLLYSTVPATVRKKIAELDEGKLVSDEMHGFLYEKPEIKVVFSIRSDRLSLMNILTDRHPSLLQNYYELDALKAADAIAAIVEPARLPFESGFNTPPFEYTTQAVDKILKSVADPINGEIEAATLQIVCKHVEEALVAQKKCYRITEDDLGDISAIFQQYYENILNKLVPEERIKAQHLIEDELIDGDKRNLLSVNYIQSKFGLSQELILQLETSSLLRKERDAGGRTLYEISHDSLIVPINKVAAGRRVIEEESKRKKLEEQIQEERNRADNLKQLNEKAVFRYKLAFSLAVVSIIVAVFAVFTWLDAKAAKEKAEIEKIAAREALFQNEKGQAVAKARQLMGYGDEYRQNNGENKFQNAIQSYQKALEAIGGYKDDPLYQELTKKIQECH